MTESPETSNPKEQSEINAGLFAEMTNGDVSEAARKRGITLSCFDEDSVDESSVTIAGKLSTKAVTISGDANLQQLVNRYKNLVDKIAENFNGEAMREPDHYELLPRKLDFLGFANQPDKEANKIMQGFDYKFGTQKPTLTPENLILGLQKEFKDLL